MRWFVVFLIVANVILFFWAEQQSRPLPGESALPPPDVGRLRLLSELEKEPEAVDESVAEPVFVEENAMEVAAVPVPPVEAEPLVVEEAPQAPAVSGADLESAELSLPLIETESAGQSNGGSPAVTEVIESPSAEGKVFVPEAVAHAEEPLEQPPEVTGEQSVQVAEEPAIPPMPAEPAMIQPAMESCARVGPFNAEGADKLIASLPAATTLLSEATEEYASVDRYYVLIPPLPSRAAGYQKLKELADAGITDTWLFPSGEYRNAISLGFFSREAGAKRHAANIAKKGFATEIKEKTSLRERRWLLLKTDGDRDPVAALALPTGITAERQACP